MKNRLQFSLVALMVAILLAAVAFAALCSRSALVSGVIYLAYLGVLCFALVGALCCRHRARVFWIGFLVFGCGYGWTAFHARTDAIDPLSTMGIFGSYTLTRAEPELPTTILLSYLSTVFQRPVGVGDAIMAQWIDGAYYPAIVQKIDSANAVHIRWNDGSSAIVSFAQIQPNVPEYWHATGHSLLGMLIALIGGLLSRFAFTVSNVRESQAAAPAEAGNIQ